MDRLSKTQWLDHGLKALAASGFTALKADKLCKSLGVSRGSFYWHFKNLADFHAAVLGRWQELTVTLPISDVESAEPNGVSRIEALVQLAAGSSLQLERAVRAWAESSDNVRSAVEQVDQQRIAYLKQALLDLELTQDRATARAFLIYYAFLGQMIFYPKLETENRQKIIDELIELTTNDDKD
ncbi:MAG: TetR/AcrR family transcriptional regulator [Chloroflexota bacterium]